jgi:uncharacterized membrane protein
MTSGNAEQARLQYVLGSLLRDGVVLAASVVILGAIIYLKRHGVESPDYHAFRGEVSDLRSITGTLADALGGRGRGIIQLGLILLIATPVARVAFSVYGFARERDYKYVVITVIVLGLLSFSLFAG